MTYSDRKGEIAEDFCVDHFSRCKNRFIDRIGIEKIAKSYISLLGHESSDGNIHGKFSHTIKCTAQKLPDLIVSWDYSDKGLFVRLSG